MIGAFFCFLLEGGVLESRLLSLKVGSSPSEFSSSEDGFARFFGAALVGLSVVCLALVAAFGTALGFAVAAAFFAGALVFL